MNVSSRFLNLCVLALVGLTSCPSSLYGQTSVTTSRYDNGRTGLNDAETYLNPSNVNIATFAKLGSYNVDGYVVAQPLYMPNISIGGVSHNVVYVATQHDSLYAFDADNLTGAPLWQVSFINPSGNVTTVPISEQGCAKVNGYTEMGIQGTPVIDPTTNTLYVDVKTKEVVNGTTNYVHRLHAIDITTGAEKFGGPVQITGSIPTLHGTLTFDTAKGCQRPGLLLSNATVYIAFGSNGCDNTHGWVFAYDAATLTQLAIYNTSPNQTRGSSVWQAGAGIAADATGNVFFISANGTFDVNNGGSDYGDTFLKLDPTTLDVTDYFTPYDQANMAANDLDLGSGGAVVVSNLDGMYSSVVIGAGKTGTIYVVNPTDMGHYSSTTNNVIQWMQTVVNEVDATPAFWNDTVYFAPDHAPAVSYSLQQDGTLVATGSATGQIIPVGGPTLSANGNTNGIMWLVRNDGNTARQLSAFDATKMVEIYNTAQSGTRDTLGMTAHFVVPTVANGKVFVGTQTQLVVYGLMPVIAATSGSNQTGTAGSTLPIPLSIQVTNPYTGSPLSGVSVTFSGLGSFGTPTVVTDTNGNASTTYTLPTTITQPTITITAGSTGYASGTFTETVTPAAPAKIAYVSGGSQSGIVGTMLTNPVVYKVTDQYGNAIPGVAVTFADSPNHGIFGSNPVTTDSTGKATVTYTLPTRAGYTGITPSAGAVVGNRVQEHALAGAAASIAITSGNKQSAPPNTLLSRPLTVKVTDQYGNPVAGVTVTYTDNGAGGIFSSPTAVTSASGLAGVSYTTPAQAGLLTINASAGSLGPVSFLENVT